MPISETRLAVRLTDNATSGLRNLTTTYSRFSNAIQASGKGLAQFNGQLGGSFASNADKAAGSLANMNKTMERLVYSASRYFVIYKALGAVGNVWDTLVGGSYDYAKSLETNQIGIAGILKSMITLNGEQVKWNDAMAISGKAMKGLQSEALRTAATSQELIETFRALLGPGLSSGMNIDQIVQLSTVGTNAVRSLGLPTNQYVQELRSIITEGIRPASSTLATSLGITNKDIKAAKASSEGLFKFLMDRMQGFSDAVKYTSDTVEGRMARIQEGLQVGGAKAGKELYKAWSGVLEQIANYLIPIPEKLGDKWEINPGFVKAIKEVSENVGKIANGLADVGKVALPLIGGIGSGGLTALGQLADKMGYLVGFMLTKRLSPFAADIANIATNSREAYEAQTSLGRAIQGVSDRISGRAAELQKFIAQQNVYNASISAFLAETSRMNSINGMVNSNANSVTNLATKWQKMGMDASRAGEIQQAVLGLMASAHNEAAQALIKRGDEIAANIEKTNRYKTAVKQAYDAELQAIRQVIREQNTKKVTDKEKVTNFLGGTGDKKPYKWQVESTNELIAKLQELKLEEEQVYNLTLQYTNALKKGGQDAAAVIQQQIIASAQNFINTKENLAVKQREISLNNEIILQNSALANAYRMGKEPAYQALSGIIEREQRLIAEMKKRGMVTTEVEQQFIEMLNAVASATDKETSAILKNTEQLIANKEAQIGLNTEKEKAIQKATTMISTFGNLSMGVGVLCDMLGQASEENKEWWESAGNAAMQASMFAMGIGSIASAVGAMIPALAQGIAKLKEFAFFKNLAGFSGWGVAGIAAGAAAAVGATVYSKYKEFEETGVASATDEWTGEDVSMRYKPVPVDDADSYAIANDPSYNYSTAADTSAIGLKFGGGAGGSAGGGGKGGGGGSAKANKAEEYAAKMLKIYEDLNKEISSMNGQATAYEKTMATARDKLAGYEKDIVKAQQLGIDVGEIRSKQLEYQLAMERKATEAQQDENLKYMKLNEESANRMNILGLGSMDQQREVYGQRLEEHKAYLEELLSADIENHERRMQLEQELANVQKQINDNSVYEFKSGWAQALDELANRQINFKDAFVGAFDSIEGSLVTLVSSTGSAKDKFKQFCEDITNTILKSMTQIIIKGLLTKLVMNAIGLGGGSVGAGDLSGMSSLASSFTGGSLVGTGGIHVGVAGGGTVQAGGTYVVGENGPELLQMGSHRGRVYNNRQTDAMMNGIENIKVEVINRSGQEVKADNANVRFDGKSMIISTVIEAVNTNYMGMRSMLKGVATT